jgi:hypothetical protein
VTPEQAEAIAIAPPEVVELAVDLGALVGRPWLELLPFLLAAWRIGHRDGTPAAAP